ncbi:MAG: hypothetical protein GX897_10850 [Clostridiales bacterium]|nr:hypothetical protein [Clostridiales bacterium]
MKAFKALLFKDDLETPEKYIWTVAYNALSNYYRDKTKTAIGIPIIAYCFEDKKQETIANELDIPRYRLN